MARLDSLRLYDISLLNIFRDPVIGIKVKNVLVPVIFATPERAFSEMVDLIGKGLFAEYPELKNPLKPIPEASRNLRSDMSLVPLPFMSLARTGMVYREESRNFGWWRPVATKPLGLPYLYNRQFKNATPIYASDKGEAVASDYPRPYTISYQLDIWTRYRHDANNIIQQIMQFGNPEFVLAIDFNVPWGIQRFHCFRENNIADNSDLESNDDQAWRRHTASYYIEGFLLEAYESFDDIPSFDDLYINSPYRVTYKYPTVREIDTRVTDSSNTEAYIDDKTKENPVDGTIKETISSD